MDSPRGRVDSPRRRLAAAVALVLLLAATGGAGETVAGGDRVRWQPGLDVLGRRAAEALPALRAQVDRRLGFAPDPRSLEVVVLSGESAMRAEAGAHVPSWAAGVAQPERGRVLLRADLVAQGYGGGLTATLRHELVHLAWGRRAGPRHRDLPLWVEEGIAEEVGGGLSLDLGAALDLAALNDDLIPFRDLAARFPADPRHADLAYKQARSWVRHFLQRRGWDELRAILDDVASGRAAPASAADTSFEAAVRQRTGRGVEEWELAWRKALREEARPWFHLLFKDVDAAVLMVGAFVAAAFFFVLRHQRRREIQALETGPQGPGEDGGEDE